MPGLSLAHESALRQPTSLVFCAIEIIAPDFTLRMLDGSTELTMDGNLYVGGDPTYGSIQAVEGLGDGVGDEAPSCRIILNPPTNAASANLGAPKVQGSPVSVWFGALNPENGAYIDRYLWFAGEVDHAVLNVGATNRSLTVECTAMDSFFEQDTGVRLTNSWHQFLYPGERGLEYHTAVNRQVPWGIEGNNAVPTPQQAVQSVLSSFFGRG